MKMAKANEADLRMAMELATALEWFERDGYFPQALRPDEDGARFDILNGQHCIEAMEYLCGLARSASLFRVAYGMVVLLDPRNQCVDPDADTLELHPDLRALREARKAKPLSEYHEDLGTVLWWRLPVDEPPYVGTPGDSDWPGTHTHWTPLIVPTNA